MNSHERVLTDRLELRRPVAADAPALHAINADPRVWTHFPSLRPTDPERSAAQIKRWSDGWDAEGLSTWVVKERRSEEIVGYAGCSSLDGLAWNLGYRFSPEVQGRGYATEASRAGVEHAHRVAPDRPVVAYLVEHNAASAAVARKVGLKLVHRAPDVGNPDPEVMRLVFAERALSEEELAATLG